MKVSYEGIGQWAATFACTEAVEGEMVKISGSGEVSACAAGDGFCGQVLSVGRDGEACAVALGGMVTASYSGDTAPSLDWCALVADGEGGVRTAGDDDDNGRSHLVVDVDTSGKTVTFAL